MAAFLVALLPCGWFVLYAYHAHRLPSVPMEFEIEPGARMRAIAGELATRGVVVQPAAFRLLARIFGKDSRIKPGIYQIDAPAIAPLDLLVKITQGDVTMSDVTFVEGQTFAQLRQVLDEHPDVRHTLADRTEAEVLQEIGARETAAEGLFFPDTYFFNKGTRDVDLLKRAYKLMQSRVEREWARRDPALPYKDFYQALIMASIIEKETARSDERPLVSAVFVNRLRRGMKLQTDPTVIYGLGGKYTGSLRKRDLQTDTAYNTYTRFGLPPTPIAMPGLASIRAALNPVGSNALFFVARGDGSHEFTESLEEHNRAVNKYQK